MACMRRPLALLALLAIALSACGDASSSKDAAVVEDPASPKAKTPSGKAPAVVILPDSGGDGTAEAKKLAQLGMETVVVNGPASAPRQPAAFEAVVADAQRAIASLKKRASVDPTRIGVIGEGVGAHVGAVVAGREPGLISAAVLADIGGVVVPSKRYSPARWLEKAAGIHVLLQRDLGARAMSEEELAELIDVAPPGTVMEQYDDLGATAQRARDRWLEDQLVSG